MNDTGSDPEEVDMEQLLAAIAADWQLLQTLRDRLPRLVAQARQIDIPGRVIARVTNVPERNVRRWAQKANTTAGAE